MRNIVPRTRIKRHFLAQRVFVNFWNLATLKRRKSAQQQVRYTAKGPNVNFVVVLQPADKLGRHVQRRAENERHALGPVEPLRKSKINHFKLEVFFVAGDEHEVLELEVAMGNVVRVNVPQCLQNLLYNEIRSPLRIRLAMLSQPLHNRASFQILADYIVVLFIFQKIINLHNIRMVQLSRNLHFIMQQALVNLVNVDVALPHHLYGILGLHVAHCVTIVRCIMH